ncbi:hypothetical protein ACIOHR_37645 [Streptomyces anulatus]
MEALGLRPDVARVGLATAACSGGGHGLVHAARFLRGRPGGRALVVAAEQLSTLTTRWAYRRVCSRCSTAVCSGTRRRRRWCRRSRRRPRGTSWSRTSGSSCCRTARGPIGVSSIGAVSPSTRDGKPRGLRVGCSRS